MCARLHHTTTLDKWTRSPAPVVRGLPDLSDALRLTSRLSTGHGTQRASERHTQAQTRRYAEAQTDPTTPSDPIVQIEIRIAQL